MELKLLAWLAMQMSSRNWRKREQHKKLNYRTSERWIYYHKHFANKFGSAATMKNLDEGAATEQQNVQSILTKRSAAEAKLFL